MTILLKQVTIADPQSKHNGLTTDIFIENGVIVSIESNSSKKADQAIEWIENAFNIVKDKTTLTKTEKNVAARSVDFLATLYAAKRDKNRTNQKLYDELDAKFTKYDLLHDKYQ